MSASLGFVWTRRRGAPARAHGHGVWLDLAGWAADAVQGVVILKICTSIMYYLYYIIFLLTDGPPMLPCLSNTVVNMSQVKSRSKYAWLLATTLLSA